MDDFSVSAILDGDSSGFQDAVAQASDSLSSFLDIASGVATGIGAADLFGALTGDITGLVSSTTSTATEFQNWGATINDVGSTTEDMFSDLGSAASASGASQANAALEATDAYDTYNEKMQAIQANIADVLAGTNITDAVSKYTQTLEDDQQAYADKVASINQQIADTNASLLQTEQDNQQKMNDTLSDMADSQADKVADTKEKQQQEIDDATTASAKQALIKKFAQENQLEADSYARAYATKQAELQQSLNEENAKAQTANQTKLTNYQNELANESAAEDQKEAKLKKDSDTEVASDQAANAKKLASYQKELADEERSYELTLAKEKAAAAKAGGGGGSSGSSSVGMLKLSSDTLQVGDSLARTKTSATQLFNYFDKIKNTTPFNIADLEEAGETLLTNKANAASLLTPIQNIAGFFNKKPQDVVSAVIMAMHGRAMQLKNTFGITADEMAQALGKSKNYFMTGKASANDVLLAIQKIGDTHFADGIKDQTDRSTTNMNRFNNQIIQTQLELMGINEATGKPIKGGLFDSMQTSIKNLTDFMASHRSQIDAFATSVGHGLLTASTIVGDAFKVLGNIIKFFMDHSKLTESLIAGIATAILTALIPAMVTFATVSLPAAITGMISLGLAAAPFILVGAGVALVAYGIIEAFQHWNQIMKTVEAVVGDLVSWVKTNFDKIILFLGPAGLLVLGIKAVYDNWNTILKTVKDAVAVFVDIVTGNWKQLLPAIEKVMSDIGNLLKGMAGTFMQWGENLANSFINGIKNVLKDVGSVLTGPINDAFKMFKGHSPPTEGPLKDIDTWGYNVGMSWVQGLQKAMGSVSIPGSMGAGAGVSGIGSLGAGSGAYNVGTYNANQISNQLSISNLFNVNSTSTAQLAASAILMQLEHRGLN